MISNPSAKSIPLSALLSKILVGYTVELDNEFELRMARAGFIGARLSLVVWANLFRFIPDEGISFRDLAARSISPQDGLKLQLGCLERWGFVTLRSQDTLSSTSTRRSAPKQHIARRDGWGSTRGIALNWTVHMTPKGKEAANTWKKLWSEIEERWKERYSREDIANLRSSLQSIAKHAEIELPLGFPFGGEDEPYPVRSPEKETDLPLSALLSQVLLMFTIDFNHRSRFPLALCANVIRVLGEEPIRAGELPILTGGSSEASDIGWRLRPFVELMDDKSGRRGKAIRLSSRGLSAKQEYYRLTNNIEKDWEKRFGATEVGGLRSELQNLLGRKRGDQSILALGLVPPPGTARSGAPVPALGRRDVGPAARQRNVDLVEQTKRFLQNPEESLPHYPMWDMNRGFGP